MSAVLPLAAISLSVLAIADPSWLTIVCAAAACGAAALDLAE